jgi:hypothetical protein
LKTQIRNNVFETNSSSVHSIVYSKAGLEPCKIRRNKNNEIVVDYGQFDKDERLYTSQEDKLSYLVTLIAYIAGNYDGGTNEVYNSYEFERLSEAICEYSGASGIHIKDKETPYIDHQSIPGICSGCIIDFYDSDDVINFVFNKDISLHTTCD